MKQTRKKKTGSTGSTKDLLFKVSGQWDKLLYLIDAKTGDTTGAKGGDRGQGTPHVWPALHARLGIPHHHHPPHHASLLKSSIKQVVCFGAWGGTTRMARDVLRAS